MPTELPFKLLPDHPDDPDDPTQWRVERLSRWARFTGSNRGKKYCVSTDARLVPYIERDGRLVRGTPSPLKPVTDRHGRTDLRVWCPALDKEQMVRWHRVVAFAWCGGKVEGVGGEPVRVRGKLIRVTSWRSLLSWGFEADHGERGPNFVLIDDLRFVTPARNIELRDERVRQTKREADVKRKLERERSAKRRKLKG